MSNKIFIPLTDAEVNDAPEWAMRDEVRRLNAQIKKQDAEIKRLNKSILALKKRMVSLLKWKMYESGTTYHVHLFGFIKELTDIINNEK